MMKIIHGETLTITATAVYASGAPVPIVAGWSAACAVIRHADSSPMVTVPMTISGGVASSTFDTGDAPWSAGRYRYDIRITDPSGNDYWLPEQDLVLLARITSAS